MNKFYFGSFDRHEADQFARYLTKCCFVKCDIAYFGDYGKIWSREVIKDEYWGFLSAFLQGWNAHKLSTEEISSK